MKNTFRTILVASSLLAMAACSKVPVGNVGIKVNLYGSDKGINATELPTGRYWIGVNEELFVFPTFTQTYSWTNLHLKEIPVMKALAFKLPRDWW